MLIGLTTCCEDCGGEIGGVVTEAQGYVRRRRGFWSRLRRESGHCRRESSAAMRNGNATYLVGLDVGSTTVKAVAVDTQTDRILCVAL